MWPTSQTSGLINVLCTRSRSAAASGCTRRSVLSLASPSSTRRCSLSSDSAPPRGSVLGFDKGKGGDLGQAILRVLRRRGKFGHNFLTQRGGGVRLRPYSFPPGG